MAVSLFCTQLKITGSTLPRPTSCLFETFLKTQKALGVQNVSVALDYFRQLFTSTKHVAHLSN